MVTSIAPQIQPAVVHNADPRPSATGDVHPSATLATLDVGPTMNGIGVPSTSSWMSPPLPARLRNRVPSAPHVKPRGLVRPLASTSTPVGGAVTGDASWDKATDGRDTTMVKTRTQTYRNVVVRSMV